MSSTLHKLAQEDPTFKVHIDSDTGQTIISGMGELHLEIITERMLREFKVQANVGKPQVAYKETIRKKSDGEAKFIRQTGGRGQYGHVKLSVEPASQGSGFIFENALVGGGHPKRVYPGYQGGNNSSYGDRNSGWVSDGRCKSDTP